MTSPAESSRPTGRAPGADAPTVSFEIMPPRRPEAAPKFWETVRRLAAARPDFVSVTYGAAGTDRETAVDVVGRLTRTGQVLPIAHLTCVGASRFDVGAVIGDFLQAGATSFLALRGDPPADDPDWQPAADGVHSSVELIGVLREAACRAGARLRIGVATFPNGNPAARTTRAQEVARLVEKQAAGAAFAITQLFYDAGSYVHFVADARAAGVTVPILPGVLPMTDPARLARVEALTGVVAPDHVFAALAAAGPDRMHRAGIELTADLARAVLAAGAPGLHIYTFNRADPALDLLAALDLR